MIRKYLPSARRTLTLFVILSFTGIISCDDDSVMDDNPADLEPVFNLSGAKAILHSETGISSGRSKAGETYLFKIDDNGAITPIVEGIEVVSVDAVSWGIIVTINDTATFRTFYVKTDNTSGELEGTLGDFIGENQNGDVVFSNARILRKSDLTLEEIQTTLASPRVQAMSGNFAVLTDDSIYQIFDTVSGIRYNVMGCNGPLIVAMDDTRCLVDDCQGKIIIDLTAGERTEGDIQQWNHEGLTTESGAVVLSQALGANSTLYYLGEIDFEGHLTLLNDYGFEPGSGHCMNCGGPNSVLFKTGNYFIVRELTKVTVVERGMSDPVFILSDYNVTSISVSGNLVYYLAEDNLGNPITGVYDLETGENDVLSSTQPFTDIQTITG
jgi:hypothetical protein